MKSIKGAVNYVVGGVLVLASSMANAAFTGTDLAADITANEAGLVLVGAAILGVVYTVRAFSWAKKI